MGKAIERGCQDSLKDKVLNIYLKKRSSKHFKMEELRKMSCLVLVLYFPVSLLLTPRLRFDLI